MEFSINVHLTASTELLEAVNRLASAMGGGVTVPPEKTPDIKIPVTSSAKDDRPVEVSEEAPQQKEQPSESKDPERCDYTEQELMDMDLTRLISILGMYGLSPGDFEGKNTNRKLRLLILEAQDKRTASYDNPGEVDAPEENNAGTQDEPSTQEGAVSLEQARALVVQKVQAGKQEAVKKILANYGCKNVTEVGDTEYLQDVYNDLLKI